MDTHSERRRYLVEAKHEGASTKFPHHALGTDQQREIFGQFSPQEQQDIVYKLRILTSLASFIG